MTKSREEKKYSVDEIFEFLKWVAEKENSLTYFLKKRGLKDLEPWVETKRILEKQ